MKGILPNTDELIELLQDRSTAEIDQPSLT
jgi:hypothetical protein